MLWSCGCSCAVNAPMSRVNPALLVLAWGELWPHFLIAARKRGIRIAVINARLSPQSFRKYGLYGKLLRGVFKHIDLVAAQTEAYAECYAALGASADSIHVTGSVKYDGVGTDRRNSQTQALGRLLNVQSNEVVWIAGSTQAPEEGLVLDIFKRTRTEQPNLPL